MIETGGREPAGGSMTHRFLSRDEASSMLARLERRRADEPKPAAIVSSIEIWSLPVESFTASGKRRTTLSLCFRAIAVGNPLTLFLELP